VSLPFLQGRSTQDNPLVQQDIVSNLGSFPDDHPCPMVNEQPLANSGPGMNLNACQETADVRKETSQK
jgi:hypothetical protein